MFKRRKEKQSALERIKERDENKFRIARQEQYQRNIKDDQTRHQDLRNRCKDCHTIRSAWEIQKGTCNNCKQGVFDDLGIIAR